MELSQSEVISMNTFNTILMRKSVREYSDKPISDEALEMILKAGQAGPSARNRRDWHFIVIKKAETLQKMAGATGPRVSMPLLNAKMAILVCGDKSSSAGDFWEVDCSIAAQNMILAAYELGIGACWIGTFPDEERMQNHKFLFKLPDHIAPHSIITFGYPKDETHFFDIKEDKPILEKEKIHFEKW